MTVERLDDEMSSSELTHWQALYKIEDEERRRPTKARNPID